jgi:hypothetical protein
MLINVSVSAYSHGWQKLTNEEWDQAAELLKFKNSSERPVEPPVGEDGKKPWWSPGPGYIEDCMVDATHPAIQMLLKYGVEITVKPYKTEHQMLVKLSDELDRLKRQGSLVPTGEVEMIAQGVTVITHVPNLGLMLMNEVQVLEDCCTDTLQKELDEGWHMLAVCPPNAQRRPDYILGRHNKDREKNR